MPGSNSIKTPTLWDYKAISKASPHSLCKSKLPPECYIQCGRQQLTQHGTLAPRTQYTTASRYAGRATVALFAAKPLHASNTKKPKFEDPWRRSASIRMPVKYPPKNPTSAKTDGIRIGQQTLRTTNWLQPRPQRPSVPVRPNKNRKTTTPDAPAAKKIDDDTVTPPPRERAMSPNSEEVRNATARKLPKEDARNHPESP